MRDLPAERKALLTAGATMWTSAAIPEADIPSFKMADGPMGIASGRVDERDVSLLTPCPMALGASWDIDLARRVGALVGDEAVRLGVDAVLAPNLNLARSPLSGRAFEYFSEDPRLAGLLGAAWVQGVQSTGTASVAKHLVCNDSETERDSVDARVDERTLREIYLLPFELAAEAGCAGMLAAYNKVNGQWCSEHPELLSGIVKQEWGFPGFLVSDWFGTHSVQALAAGLDLEMPGPPRHLGPKAIGAVDAERLDDAAQRVANAGKRWTGAKSPSNEEAGPLLIEAAAAGFTLLRNKGNLLPLIPGTHRRIAVIGPNACAPCFQGGTFAKIAVTPEALSPIEAISARYEGETEIIFEPGVDPHPRLPSMPVREGGMKVEYFDNDRLDGVPVGSEIRDTNSLVWFVGVHDMGVFDRPAGMRASGRYTAESDGEHHFYLGGTGAVRLLVDGKEILHRDTAVAASDVMGMLKRGDADQAPVALRAGQDILIEVEFRYQPARVQGLWYGLRGPDSRDVLLARAVEAARSADAVILVVGETSDSSVESKDRPDTCLAADQLALIEQVTTANPRTAIIANVGHAFDTSWEDKADALLLTWYPGQEFGRALAEVLAGDREPGGRLPVTIARRDEDYPAYSLTPGENGALPYTDGTLIGYRGFAAAGIAPRHAFGSGFGYAEIDLLNVTLEGSAAIAKLHNRSVRRGSQVVQIYRAEPELTLVAFGKIELDAGQSGTLEIPIDPRSLRIWNEGWQKLERVTLLAGLSAADTPFRFTLP